MFDVIAADADLREREGTQIELMIMICYDQIRINHNKSIQSVFLLCSAALRESPKQKIPCLRRGIMFFQKGNMLSKVYDLYARMLCFVESKILVGN
jgi:hypothetical protein